MCGSSSTTRTFCMGPSLAPGPPLSTGRTAFAPNLHKPCTGAARRRPPRRTFASFLTSDNLLARAMALGLLTLLLLIPLSMIGSVIADRRTYEAEAAKSVGEAWGGPQVFAGPTIVLPYRPADSQTT